MTTRPGGGHGTGAPDRPSRRGALQRIAGTLLALLGVGRAAPLGASRRPTPGPRPQEPGYPVARLEDVPQEGALEASYRGQPVLVLNVDGEVRVLSAICPHEGCLAEWSEGLGVVQCPCHDGRFDTDGAVLSGPPPAPLIRFESLVVEGTIFIVEG